MVVERLKSLGKVLLILLVVVLLGVIIHDLAKFATAQRTLNLATYDLTVWTAGQTGGSSKLTRDQGAQIAADEAAARGITLWQYDQTERRVFLWTESTAPNTIAIGTVVNMFRGMSFDEARTTPMRITSHHEASVT
ncbi:MAG: hypothetical protein FWE94_01375 [Coriobacteriia bacterium]|nr:hypothetical protein [Coriobacteriia bacterium]